MKKGLITLILSILFVFNVFGQKIICFTPIDNNLGLKNNYIEFITLEKYNILKDYCVENYFPTLSDKEILAGETVNDALDASNDTKNLGFYAVTFKKDNNYKIVFNDKNFLNRDEMIQLMCHELAHFSSGSFDHNTPEYKAEVNRLNKLGINIITSNFNIKKCNLYKLCRN